jgi:hypothetical protein
VGGRKRGFLYRQEVLSCVLLKGICDDDSFERDLLSFFVRKTLMMMDGGVTNMASVRFTLSSAVWPAGRLFNPFRKRIKNIYVGWWAMEGTRTRRWRAPQ